LAISLYALIINRLFREHWTYSLSYRNIEAEDREAKAGMCALVINILVRKSGEGRTAKIYNILAYHKFSVLVILSINLYLGDILFSVWISQNINHWNC
jgi:hypothetical protein